MKIIRCDWIALGLLMAVLACVPGIYSQNEKLKLEILNGHSGGGVLAVAVSADGKLALTGSTDRTALLWDLATGKQLRRFVGHEDAVSSVHFSKDGQYVLTASWDKTARLWETATGKQVRVFVESRNGMPIGHSGKILTAAISADGNLVATAGEDKTARIWDLKTGKQIFRINHADRVNSIAFSPDSKCLLTGGQDKTARLFSTTSGSLVREWVGHVDEITSVDYSPDGMYILTGSTDETVRLWDAANATSDGKIFKMRGSILTVAFAQGGRSFTVGSDFAAIGVDISSEKQLWREFGQAVAISETDDERLTLIAGGTSDRSVTILSRIPEGRRELNGKSDGVYSTDISPGFDFVVSGSAGHGERTTSSGGQVVSLRIFGSQTSGLWNLKRGQLVGWWGMNWKREDEYVHDKNGTMGQRIGYGYVNYQSVRNSAIPINRTRNIDLFLDDDFDFEEAVCISSTNLLAFTRASTTDIFELDTGKILHTLKIEKVLRDKYDSRIRFSPDSSLLLITTDSVASLWNIESGKGVGRFTGHEKPINDASFSPGGKTVATASSDGTVKIWNVGTSDVKLTIHDVSSPISGVAFSPDGKTIATASSGDKAGNAALANSIQFWDAETGRQVNRFGGDFKTFSNKGSGLKSVAYSADGKYVVAGSFDGKVYILDNTTKHLRKLEGHTDIVNSVKFSADGKYVVSGSSDSTTRIWNAATGEEICKLVTFRDGTWAVVDPKGRYEAPNGGEIDGIQWVYGNETIALNQLKDVFYTPNLLPRLLGYNKEPLRPVPDLNSLKLFPKIVEQKLDEANARLTVKLQNRGGGIGELRVLVNGKLATEDARDARLRENPTVADAVVTFDLKGSAGFDPKRKNTIEVITNNYDPAIKKGYISSRGAEIVYAGNAQAEVKQPNFYAVVGGVSDYNGTALDLAFAAKDAEEFAHALELGARRLFCPKEKLQCEKVRIALLSTSGKEGTILPTKQNYRQAIADVAKAALPEDVFVIYLAGHGTSVSLNGKDTYLYLTQEADKASKDALENLDYRTAAAISSEELLDWLTQTKWVDGQKGVQALKQVMILDTCAAGSAAGDLSVMAKRDLTADQILALERLKDRTGFHILMGSAADQSSYEANRYGQGLLTYALLQGIRGAALDQDQVATQTLFDYALKTVPTLANGIGGVQQPRIFGTTSIPIGLITESDKNSIKLALPKPVLLRPLLTNPETGDDDLRLIVELRKRLGIESSYEVVRRRDGTEPVLVYIDDDTFPGGIRVTGNYTTDGDNIRIKAFLRKDGKTIATLPEITVAKAQAVDELTAVLRAALAKL